MEAAEQIQKECELTFDNLWDVATEEDVAAAWEFAEEYKQILMECKTERLFVDTAVQALEEQGFKPLRDMTSLTAGDQVYHTIKGKGLMAAVIGKRPAADGFNILGAHIDSPRLDLKPIPLYEDGEMALLKTHYYGGIKRYQWTAIPLAIHGVVIRRDGITAEIHVGEDATDPVLTVTELLIHLSKEQLQRKGNQIIKGEELNVLVGGKPLGDKEVKNRFKLAILKMLNDQYGIVEEDLVTAELEIVPAGPARDVGLDRAFIGGYGQDDRVCAYPSLRAIMDVGSPEKTIICLLSDKEEVGSDGNTGAQSRLYENVLAEIFAKQSGSYNDLAFRQLLEKCKMLSTDVTNGFDPTFASVSDKQNAAFMGKGMCLNKYTGSGGKYNASDANAEFMAQVIGVLRDCNVPWQTGLMGKIDAGGGGTIAKYMANMGMEVIDCGVPVLSMHAPFEITHKLDVYYTYLAYKAFVENI
ncbi:MAG TPA: aminopeptidase [Clostridiaceae bacterium]|nr:aminopeptidase [Clostridiaceae bacterium]